MRGSAGAAVTVGALLARVSDVFSYDAPMVSYVKKAMCMSGVLCMYMSECLTLCVCVSECLTCFRTMRRW